MPGHLLLTNAPPGSQLPAACRQPVEQGVSESLTFPGSAYPYSLTLVSPGEKEELRSSHNLL